MEKRITLPLTEEIAKTLKAGDTVYLTGTIYTSRDAGHKRMCNGYTIGTCYLFTGSNKIACVPNYLFIYPSSSFILAGANAVEQVQTHSYGTNVKVMFAYHLYGFQNFSLINHKP